MPVPQVNQELVGGNYANALVEIAQEQNALEAVHSDMDALSAVFSDSEDIAAYLQSPVVAEEQKKAMIATLGTEAGFNEYTVNFLNLLVDKQRMDCIEEVMSSFETKYCELTDTQVSFNCHSPVSSPLTLILPHALHEPLSVLPPSAEFGTDPSP